MKDSRRVARMRIERDRSSAAGVGRAHPLARNTAERRPPLLKDQALGNHRAGIALVEAGLAKGTVLSLAQVSESQRRSCAASTRGEGGCGRSPYVRVCGHAGVERYVLKYARVYWCGRDYDPYDEVN